MQLCKSENFCRLPRKKRVGAWAVVSFFCLGNSEVQGFSGSIGEAITGRIRRSYGYIAKLERACNDGRIVHVHMVQVLNMYIYIVIIHIYSRASRMIPSSRNYPLWRTLCIVCTCTYIHATQCNWKRYVGELNIYSYSDPFSLDPMLYDPPLLMYVQY